MTYKEAIEILQMHKNSTGCDVVNCMYDNCFMCTEAYNKAIEALERQMFFDMVVERSDERYGADER